MVKQNIKKSVKFHLTPIQTFTFKQLCGEKNCYGTKEFSIKSTMCKLCSIYKECGKVFPKKCKISHQKTRGYQPFLIQ